ncbi:MAG: hypothetical protein FWF76_02845 [Oscillospiraceae bacterium]|nr:hypothetical protein [Oscillospiraceae bacterium]
MNHNKKLPTDIISLCEDIAKGYNRRRKDYENRRLDIMYHSGARFENYTGGAKGIAVSNPVARKVERLERLESGLDYKFIKAVENSLSKAGSDLPNDCRKRLTNALMLNSENGKDFPYEKLGLDEFSRRDFYRRRKKFIIGIGAFLGILTVDN